MLRLLRAVFVRRTDRETRCSIESRLHDDEARRESQTCLAPVAALAARLAHELSNPLAVVKANIAWLGEARLGGCDEAEIAQVLRETLASVDRISLIAADLRDLAKVVPCGAAPCRVSQVLDEALGGIAASLRREVRTRGEQSLETVADRALLAQCVRHLVIAGASLANDDPSQPLWLHATRTATEIVIALDTREIPAEAIGGGRVVHPAHVTTGSHAGLHVALGAELARAMGGSLETVSSSDGVLGLRVRLPRGRSPIEES